MLQIHTRRRRNGKALTGGGGESWNTQKPKQMIHIRLKEVKALAQQVSLHTVYHNQPKVTTYLLTSRYHKFIFTGLSQRWVLIRFLAVTQTANIFFSWTDTFISLFVSGSIYQSKPFWEGTCTFQYSKNNIQKVAWEDLAHLVWPYIWLWPLAAMITVGEEEGACRRGGQGSVTWDTLSSWLSQYKKDDSQRAWPRVHSDCSIQLLS